jgi:hypothetical protein
MKNGSSVEFGNRKLTTEDDVFEHNAWYSNFTRDQVEMDPEMEIEALKMIEKQRQGMVTEEEKCIDF